MKLTFALSIKDFIVSYWKIERFQYAVFSFSSLIFCAFRYILSQSGHIQNRAIHYPTHCISKNSLRTEVSPFHSLVGCPSVVQPPLSKMLLSDRYKQTTLLPEGRNSLDHWYLFLSVSTQHFLKMRTTFISPYKAHARCHQKYGFFSERVSTRDCRYTADIQ